MRTLHEQPAISDVPPFDAEVLIREARRLRRRRWFLGVVVVLLAAGVLTAVTVGGRGSGRGTGATNGRPFQAGRVAPSQRAVVSVRGAPFIVQSGLVSAKEGWGLNGQVLYLTTNGGGSWKTITPKNMEGQADRLDGVGAVGQSHLWVPFSDMPGTRCQGGSCRYSAIDWTTNAGQIWHVSYLPGCFDCGISVSFLNSEDGFALGQHNEDHNRSSVQVYETTDGGRSWTTGASLLLPIGPGSNALTFSSKSDGWFVIAGDKGVGPYRPIGQPHVATAELYRTTDGGKHWTNVALPMTSGSTDQILGINAPQFFAGGNGVVTATVENTTTRQDRAVIYTTTNGGRTWVGTSAPPRVANSVVDTDGNLTTSIVSPKVWFLVAGTRLYVTRNAGRSWSSSTPSASWSAGQFRVGSIDFVSVSTGWANVLYNSCGGLPRSTPTTQCRDAVGLAATTNGGRTWRLLSASV